MGDAVERLPELVDDAGEPLHLLPRAWHPIRPLWVGERLGPLLEVGVGPVPLAGVGPGEIAQPAGDGVRSLPPPGQVHVGTRSLCEREGLRQCNEYRGLTALRGVGVEAPLDEDAAVTRLELDDPRLQCGELALGQVLRLVDYLVNSPGFREQERIQLGAEPVERVFAAPCGRVRDADGGDGHARTPIRSGTQRPERRARRRRRVQSSHNARSTRHVHDHRAMARSSSGTPGSAARKTVRRSSTLVERRRNAPVRRREADTEVAVQVDDDGVGAWCVGDKACTTCDR